MASAQARLPGGPNLWTLPEGCIATVVSFTSPADACRLACVSPVFKSGCDSDAVWATFLPPDWRSMVDRRAPSLKKLYFSLCDDPVLLGDGNMSFSLDRHSGKKCIMLSARALSIIWGNTPIYWSWTCMPNSRFAEVAELIHVCWLEIRGSISSSMLSPGTRYAAYLVFKFIPNSDGFEFQSVEVGAGFASDEVDSHERLVYLCRESNTSGWWTEMTFSRTGRSSTHASAEGNGNYPKERRDGWSEIELGEFLTKEGEDREVKMSVKETKNLHWKAGLVVEGIEIRPKDGK